MIDKPLYENPLAGGMFNVTPPSTPVSEQTPLPGIIGDPADLPQPTEGVSQDVFGNPNYLDGTTSVNPIVTGPQEIASAETNPFNRVGQQLTGPNQDDILGTLKNIEQGIASLGQGGMDQLSFGGFNNNFGIGSFFPPYGGMYG